MLEIDEAAACSPSRDEFTLNCTSASVLKRAQAELQWYSEQLTKPLYHSMSAYRELRGNVSSGDLLLSVRVSRWPQRFGRLTTNCSHDAAGSSSSIELPFHTQLPGASLTV